MLSSAHELRQALDFAQHCIQARCEPLDIAATVTRLQQLIPSAELVIALDEQAALRLNDPRQVLNFGFAEEWLTHYFAEQLFDTDPVLTAARHSNSAFTWQACYQRRPESASFRLLAASFVGEHGLTCSVRSTQRASSTVLSLRMSDAASAERYSALLDYLAPHVHEIFNRPGSLNRHCLQAPEISGREREVLHWAKEGKSTWDISTILCISERTVKFHFGNIFRKLDVLNRSQAIAKAIHYGMIAV